MKPSSVRQALARWSKARRQSTTRSMKTLFGCVLVCEYAFFVSDLLWRDFCKLDVDNVFFVCGMDLIRTSRSRMLIRCACRFALSDPWRRFIGWMRFSGRRQHVFDFSE